MKNIKILSVLILGALIATLAGHSLGKTGKVIKNDDYALGQSFIVGIPDTYLDIDTREKLEHIRPAGIVLYRRNFLDFTQLSKLIHDLQALAVQTTGQKYFIMIDEEPGGAERLDLFSNVFVTGEPDWRRLDTDVKKLKKIGVNVLLAPVADFPFNDDSFIKSRVQARTEKSLTKFNENFIKLLAKYNLDATLKHFPGMGIFTEDPHRGVTIATSSTQVINRSLAIFKSGILSGSNFVMTSHGIYTDIDADNPATFSKKIVEGLLRTKLKFKGIVITDDLSDMPLLTGEHVTLDDAAIRSISAGHNMVMFSHDLKRTSNIFDQVLRKIKEDDSLKLKIYNNFDVVSGYKAKKGGISY